MIGRQRKGRHVFCIDKNTDIVRARDLMREKKVRHLPVVDEHKRLIGIVSDRDIRTAIPREAYENRESLEAYASSEAIKITEIMTKDPYCISATYTLQDALLLFKKTKVGAFPIVDQDQTVVGIISDRDLLHGFIDLLGVGSPGCFIGVVIPLRLELSVGLSALLPKKKLSSPACWQSRIGKKKSKLYSFTC
jgi:acetoin utilization protein AcuB